MVVECQGMVYIESQIHIIWRMLLLVEWGFWSRSCDSSQIMILFGGAVMG
jgi:hypothetical protein